MSTEEPKVPKNIRDLIATREEARAELRKAEAEQALKAAELNKVKAEILRADVEGVLKVGDVMRW